MAKLFYKLTPLADLNVAGRWIDTIKPNDNGERIMELEPEVAAPEVAKGHLVLVGNPPQAPVDATKPTNGYGDILIKETGATSPKKLADVLADKVSKSNLAKTPITPTGSSVSRGLGDILARPKGRLQIVGTRGIVPSNSTGGGATNYTNFESQLLANLGKRDVRSIALAYCNYYKSTGENPIGNGYALNASLVGTLSGATVPVPITFGGARALNVAPGAAIVISDEIPAMLAAGSLLRVRSSATVASGELVAGGHRFRRSGEIYSESLDALDANFYITSGLSTTGVNAATEKGFGPLAILGVPEEPIPAVVIWGDSIQFGQGDSHDTTTGALGYVERGLTNVDGNFIPWSNISRTGETLNNAKDQWFRQRAILPYATHAICGLGNNSIGAGTTLATMQAEALVQWLACRRAGLKIYQANAGPRTDAGNTTVTPGFGTSETRGQWNAWLLTKVADGTIDGVIDVNSVWADPANPDKWRPEYTGSDGTHPPSVAHIAAADQLIRPLVRTFTV